MTDATSLTALPEEPLVSICMAACNAAPFVAEAVGSVLAQTYRHTEIVIVDDGSTDGTGDIIRSFGDPRIRFFRHESNHGGYETMNEAIELAVGDPVAVFHADDLYSPLMVEREVAFLQKHASVSAVFTQNHMISAAGRRKGTNRLPDEFHGREVFDYDTVFRFLLRRKNILLCCPTFMARRAVFREVGLFDAERYHVAADIDMWIRILRRYPIGVIDEALMSYRHTSTQWSRRYRRLRLEEELHFEILDRYLREDGWLSRLGTTDLAHHEFHRIDDQTFRAANAIIVGDPGRARDLMALGSFPWRSLLDEPSRRKVRVLLLRLALRAVLFARVSRVLAPLLRRTEH